jgi:hypothetical protein
MKTSKRIHDDQELRRYSDWDFEALAKENGTTEGCK